MSDRVYHRLTIAARDPNQNVTVMDSDGHHVASSLGTVNVSVLRGLYLYRYGRDGRVRPVCLDDDVYIEQAAYSEKDEQHRTSVDGTAYISPNRPCTTEGCADRLHWDGESAFACTTCGATEKMRKNEEILLKNLVLEVRQRIAEKGAEQTS